MNTHKGYWLTGILVMVAAAVAWPTQLLAENDEEQEEVVSLQDVPKPVQKTIRREAAGGKIEKIEKEIRGNRTIYEADLKIDGKEYEAKILPNGTLLIKKLEHAVSPRKRRGEMERHMQAKKKEEKIDPDDVPDKVMKAVEKKVPGGTVKEAEKETIGRKVIYEIEKVVDGRESEVKVLPNGRIIKIEREDEEHEHHGAKKEREHDEDDD